MIAAVQERAVTEPVPNDDSLYEVVYGVRVEVPPMSVFASLVNNRLCKHLSIWGDEKQLGFALTETLFIFDERGDERRRPDTAFVSRSKWPLDRVFPATGDWRVIPDLAVEVISPSETFEDVLEKMQEYFEFGVQEVWIVTPLRREAHVYTSPKENRIFSAQDVLEGPILPGFKLPLDQLFLNAPALVKRKNDV
jgi:Uma2 family endonuclease